LSETEPINRRDALRKIGGGFAMMSFAAMIGDSIAKAEVSNPTSPWMIKDPHFKPKLSTSSSCS